MEIKLLFHLIDFSLASSSPKWFDWTMTIGGVRDLFREYTAVVYCARLNLSVTLTAVSMRMMYVRWTSLCSVDQTVYELAILYRRLLFVSSIRPGNDALVHEFPVLIDVLREHLVHAADVNCKI